MKKITAFILAFVLMAGSFAAVTNAANLSVKGDNTALAYIELAEELIFTDAGKFSAGLSSVLERAMEALEEDNTAARELLESVKALADAKSSDTVGMIALLEAAKALISEQGAPAEEMPEAPAETTEAEITEEMTTEAETAEEVTTETETAEEVATEEATETVTTEAETTEEATTEETTEEETTEAIIEEQLNRPESNLPEYVQDKFKWDVLNSSISLQVPADWGNNKSDSAFTRYSPANRSGAVSPQSGTLQTSYFMFTSSDEDAFRENEADLAKVDGISNYIAQDTSVAGVKGRRINYSWALGANSFDCEIVCIAHEGVMYAVELLQGSRRQNNFYDVFDTSVGSIVFEIMENPEEPEEPEGPGKEPQNPGDNPAAANGTLADFTYYINGHPYVFPTDMSEVDEADFPIDFSDPVVYEILPDANTGGLFNELANTSYYFLAGGLCNELLGITNMKQKDITAREGILTDIVDLKGNEINITLAGNVSVGSPESSIISAFPYFDGMELNGYAGFIDNDFLYACNVRPDGCNGYVIIKNNAPFYSTMSIICEDGVVREICLECLGSNKAKGIFLPD